MAVVYFGVIAAIAAVLWFTFGHTPEDAASHEGEPLSRAQRAGRDVAGPADAGAEGMATPSPGAVGPRDRP